MYSLSQNYDDKFISSKNIFFEAPSNFKYCIEDEEQISKFFSQITSTNRDCSLNCYQEHRKYHEKTKKCIFDCNYNSTHVFEYGIDCYESCPKRTNTIKHDNVCYDLNCEKVYNFDETQCLSEVPEGYFLNDTNLKTIDKCHPNCRTCMMKESLFNTNCKSCPVGKYLDSGRCVGSCEYGWGVDEKDKTISFCKCRETKCLICSEESLKDELCISCNEGYFYEKNDPKNKGGFVNCMPQDNEKYKSKNGECPY
jgi:hypothetical protein